MVVQRRAQVLGISATILFHLHAVRELIQRVRAHAACRDVKILVGGYPFLASPDLWTVVGRMALRPMHRRPSLCWPIIAREAMNPPEKDKGMALLCSPDGTILRIIRDDLGLSSTLQAGATLFASWTGVCRKDA